MSPALPLWKGQESLLKLSINWDLLEALKQSRTQGWQATILVIKNSEKIQFC